MTNPLRSVPFLAREAFINLRRHSLMTVAAITTIAVTLTLLGTFGLTFYQMRVATQRAASEFEVRVFCREGVSKSEAVNVGQRLRALPGVASVVYLSKEKAYADYTRDLPIDTTGIPNRFNETFVVKVADPREQNRVAATARGWHALVQEVASPETELNAVLRVLHFLQTVGVAGGAVLLLGALIVVSNTIRVSVFARRREIRIMQIVGATGWFIRLPLLIEGVIHGVVGGLVAGACLWAVDRAIRTLIGDVIPMLARYVTVVNMVPVAGYLLVAGALIGTLGSLLSIRRYLRAA